MQHLNTFHRFINESVAYPELLQMRVTYKFEGNMVSGPVGILSLEDPENKNFGIEDNAGSFSSEHYELCEYLNDKFGPPPYTLDQLKDRGLQKHLSEIYADDTRTKGSKLYLEFDKVTPQSLTDVDVKRIMEVEDLDFRLQLLSLMGFDPNDDDFLMRGKEFGLL